MGAHLHPHTMRNRVQALVLAVLLLLLSSGCTALLPLFTRTEPTTGYVAHDTWAYRSPYGAAPRLAPAGTQVLIVGYYQDWWVVQGTAGKFYVAHADLVSSPVASYSGSAPPTGRYYSVPPETDGVYHDTYTGPRGGQYYYNGHGNRQYVTPQSTLNERPIQTGPRGGQYYLNDNGRKTYIKR